MRISPATLPPPGLPGLDPSWSRLVEITDAQGARRTFHVLDSWAGTAEEASGDQPVGTLLCLHGNPTWSYLWRRLLAAPPPGWRVVAPDQLGMGYSDRIERPRVLVERVDDLSRLTDALEITGPGRSGPVVTVAHDWGGIISLGWAEKHRDQLQGVVLTNTAVHQPPTSRGPLLIRLAYLPMVNRIACYWTPLFVRATTSLTWPRLPREVRTAFAAPYRTVRRRRSVGEFVADIPFAADHPSHAAVESIAEAVSGLGVKGLFLWGPRDPVFGDIYLRDLQDRLPDAVLHRYELASHLLPEDAPGYAEAVVAFVRTLDAPGEPARAAVASERSSVLAQLQARSGDESAPALALEPATVVEQPATTGPAPEPVTGVLQPPEPGLAVERPSVLAQLQARSGDESAAVVEVGGRTISWADLNTRARDIGAGLAAAGLRPGDRVALLIPPSIELTVALYAVWRAGGVIVVADRGLGLRGMGRALRSARLDYLIADTAGLLAARAMRLPGRRIAVRENRSLVKNLGRVDETMVALADSGRGQPVAPDASGNDEAAVLFTSGATGPAKGVLYRHRQVRAQLELIRTTCGLTGDDRIVAAFAPFALYGPALGLSSVVPRTDVTKPGKLTAAALGEAAASIGATVVFASPAALRNVVATSAGMSKAQRSALENVRLLMSAGASVPAQLLRRVAEVLPNADLHTPYGMTEALPLTDISLAGIEDAGEGDGVCVGHPLAGVQIALAALDHAGRSGDVLTTDPGISGEIWASADHIRDRYDAAWVTDQAAAAHPGWHRTGDIGRLDEQGRLWVQGRTVHLITTSTGPVTPVGIELAVQTRLAQAGLVADEHAGVAAVGVGPSGTQQIVVVVTGKGGPLAPIAVIDEVRGAADPEIAAVLITRSLPVDIRHNSKIDRVAVRAWAAGVLAGE